MADNKVKTEYEYFRAHGFKHEYALEAAMFAVYGDQAERMEIKNGRITSPEGRTI